MGSDAINLDVSGYYIDAFKGVSLRISYLAYIGTTFL